MGNYCSREEVEKEEFNEELNEEVKPIPGHKNKIVDSDDEQLDEQDMATAKIVGQTLAFNEHCDAWLEPENIAQHFDGKILHPFDYF